MFLAELLLRIFMEKLQFVRDVANWFDTLLVIAGLVDMFVILPMSAAWQKKAFGHMRTQCKQKFSCACFQGS